MTRFVIAHVCQTAGVIWVSEPYVKKYADPSKNTAEDATTFWKGFQKFCV
jgi:hypothetical protein